MMLMSVRCCISPAERLVSNTDPGLVLSAAPGDGEELHTLRPCLTLNKKYCTSSNAVLATDRHMHLKEDMSEMGHSMTVE